MRRIALLLVLAVLALTTANHVERALRAGGYKPQGGGGVPVPLVEEEWGGHMVLTVNEKEFRVPGLPSAAFSVLEKWAYDPVEKNPPPGEVALLDGKKVAAAGFMFPPSRDAQKTSEFFLVPSGKFHDKVVLLDELPGIARRILVRTDKAVTLETEKPVVVTGTFRTAPEPSEGWLYVMEASKVEPSADPPVALSVTDVSGLPWFDFFWLEEMGVSESRGMEPVFPKPLQAREGRNIAVEGWLFDRQEGDPRTLVAGREWWNGCCEGEAPTYFNSLLVALAPGEPLPAPWNRRGAYAGVLKLNRNPADWKEKGVARIEDARSCPPASVSRGPMAPLWLEIVAVACAGIFAFRVFLPGKKPLPAAATGTSGLEAPKPPETRQ